MRSPQERRLLQPRSRCSLASPFDDDHPALHPEIAPCTLTPSARPPSRRRSRGAAREPTLRPPLQRRGVPQLAFPDGLDAPAGGFEGGAVFLVAGAVGRHLGGPVVAVSLGDAGAAGAVVAVPEAAVDEDR